jgi:hypothetical protein
MNKREKVIVLLMLLAVGYGAVSYLPRVFAPESSQASTEEVRARAMLFVEESRTQLAAAMQDGDVEYVATRVFDAWPKNPFIGGVGPREVATVETVDVRYSGYLDHDGVLFALLNGHAYKLGDLMPDSPYCVLEITPEQVVLSVAGGEENVLIQVEKN